MMQALFEMDSGQDSQVEWQLSAEDDLEIEITPH
jgi:hypothetical protein